MTNMMIVVFKTLMNLLTYFKISVVSLLWGRDLVPVISNFDDCCQVP